MGDAREGTPQPPPPHSCGLQQRGGELLAAKTRQDRTPRKLSVGGLGTETRLRVCRWGMRAEAPCDTAYSHMRAIDPECAVFSQLPGLLLCAFAASLTAPGPFSPSGHGAVALADHRTRTQTPPGASGTVHGREVQFSLDRSTGRPLRRTRCELERKVEDAAAPTGGSACFAGEVSSARLVE